MIDKADFFSVTRASNYEIDFAGKIFAKVTALLPWLFRGSNELADNLLIDEWLLARSVRRQFIGGKMGKLSHDMHIGFWGKELKKLNRKYQVISISNFS